LEFTVLKSVLNFEDSTSKNNLIKTHEKSHHAVFCSDFSFIINKNQIKIIQAMSLAGCQ